MEESCLEKRLTESVDWLIRAIESSNMSSQAKESAVFMVRVAHADMVRVRFLHDRKKTTIKEDTP